MRLSEVCKLATDYTQMRALKKIVSRAPLMYSHSFVLEPPITHRPTSVQPSGSATHRHSIVIAFSLSGPTLSDAFMQTDLQIRLGTNQSTTINIGAKSNKVQVLDMHVSKIKTISEWCREALPDL